MRIEPGRNAFVTGAANGIGLATALALGRLGVNVALSDIEAGPLAEARDRVAALGVAAIAIPLDVSDADAMAGAAARFTAELGAPHYLFNNAGVSLRPTALVEVTQAKWDWLYGVNLFGVVNGLRAFVPLMKAHGEGGHIVNTSSIVAMQMHPFLRNIPYRTSKAALIALTECLDLEFDLAADRIGVSVFCPALVVTTLLQSSFRRPERFGGAFDNAPLAEVAPFTDVAAGITAEVAAAMILDAIERDTFFVFTHEEVGPWLRERHARIEAGLARTGEFLRATAR